MEYLLKVNNLSICYEKNQSFKAVDNVSFSIVEGENVGIIGESGSGKTSIATAIMGLLNEETKVSGEILYKNQNILSFKEDEKNMYRWSHIALVFQNNLDVLNPVLNIESQILESIIKHTNLSKKKALIKVGNLLEMVGLNKTIAKVYPHNLSGGMRQKVLIAMALACDPKILIVDEPTSALDSVSKNEIINLLLKLQKEKKITMLVISHDLYVINKLTCKLEVIYKGNILEEGLTKDLIRHPMHTYTRGIINSSIEINPFGDLWGIPYKEDNLDGGCVFYSRCIQKCRKCKYTKPQLYNILNNRKVACNRGGIVNLLQGKSINKTYKDNNREVCAVKNCNITIRFGEIVSLIGESGSGKTTLANILSGILNPDSGTAYFKDEKIQGNNLTSKKEGIQIIFQDPFSSINNSFTILETIREPLDIIKAGSKEDRYKKVLEVLKKVQLPTESSFLNKRCSDLSGGQRQRISIARGLIMEPKLLIADEISSMLDPSTKANILRLLKQLQNSTGFAMLYITHDINLAKKISDKMLVMHKGEIIESGSVLDIFNNPEKPYTKMLIS
ncbi:ABC transporter ATP-binding protein [Clostridium niameyense]|uniref:ABC transporter ATP-binding protein n=1 Tax=Clostridium niameyense TaxID=1622073 RepID=UPI00067EDD37|nr:ABC transporter ATP-binding protein [Clostridium niameyense]